MIRFGAKKNAAGQHVTASDDDDDAHEHEPGPPKKKCADDSERQQHKKYSSEIATVAASANEKSGEKVLSKAGSSAEIHRTRSGKRYAGDSGGTNEDDCSDLSSTYKGKER